MLYIDAFNHILPKKYQAVLEQKVPNRDMSSNLSRYAETVPTLLDLDARFRLMDSVEGYMQVLTLAAPTVESVASPEVAVDLCRFANDEMAELVEKYPDRFAAAIAALPLNDLDASLEEIDRAIRDLRLRGIQMYSDVNGMPLDAEALYPIYEKMERYNLPILIHPKRSPALPDYPGEENSRYRAWTKLGWPVASSMAMFRLVYGGVMERFPNLKIVTHHCGGVIPYLAGRMEWNDDFDTDFGKKYDYANLEFIKFEGKPSFNKTGTLYIYAEDKNTFVYEATEDGAKAVKAEWNEDYEAWEIKTRKLTSYVLSDVELDKQTVTEDKNESSKPESGKDNPDTGR